MKDFGIVRSTERPEEIVTDQFSVWKHTGIKKVEENEFMGYEFKMVQYDKDEYMQYITKTTTDQITDLQMALTEVYESVGGVSHG